MPFVTVLLVAWGIAIFIFVLGFVWYMPLDDTEIPPCSPNDSIMYGKPCILNLTHANITKD